MILDYNLKAGDGESFASKYNLMQLKNTLASSPILLIQKSVFILQKNY